MKHPEKWRDCADPYQIPFQKFSLQEVLGYPHAGNDVFYVRGCYEGQNTTAFLKVARQHGADIENEIKTIRNLSCPLAPQVLEYDMADYRYVLTRAMPGERLSTILGENSSQKSLDYMAEYGNALAMLHECQGSFPPVKDRRFFHIPEKSWFEARDQLWVYTYLQEHKPDIVSRCFCHGDFHYANLLWDKGHISAILDFELSGFGVREFDIAWALILRPGQRFLNTEEEIARFRLGYMSAASANWEAVRYYMVLIYAYFQDFGEEPGYRNHIVHFFREVCG